MGLGLAALLGAALLTSCGDARSPAVPPATASPAATPTPTAPLAASSPTPATASATASPAATPTPTAPPAATSPTPTTTVTPSPEPTAGAEEVRAALAALPWVRDGVSGEEADAAETVRYVAEVAIEGGFTDLFLELAEIDWVRDGLLPTEISALDSLVTIAHRNERSAARLLDMPFLATIEASDLGMLQDLEQLFPADLERALASPRLAGGINDGDAVTVSALLLESVDPEALSRLDRLGWVADGVEAGESNALLALHELALDSPNVFAAVEERG